MEKVITKIYDNGNSKAVIKIELSDPCHNGHCKFTIATELYGGRRMTFYGACRDEVAKACPELAEFFPLHLADEQGKPAHYFENTIYWYYERGLTEAAKYMRVSRDIAKKVFKDYKAQKGRDETRPYCNENQDLWDKILVKYGIFAQWQKEADKLKSFIQEN